MHLQFLKKISSHSLKISPLNIMQNNNNDNNNDNDDINNDSNNNNNKKNNSRKKPKMIYLQFGIFS